MNEDKIELVSSLTERCLVPDLNLDIGTEQMSVEHFQSYKITLSTNLHLLFDIIQQNENVMFEISTKTETFHIKFVLLICEQTASNTLYQTDEITLLQNLNIFQKKYFKKLLESNSIQYKILNYYKSKLKIDLWKQNIGAVHGFAQFCELYFRNGAFSLNINDAMFLLSVGILLIEYYEHAYKEIGVQIFLIILNCMNKNEIISANLHEAIYNSCFPMIQIVKQKTIIVKTITCLEICAKLENVNTNISKWNKIDDILEGILDKILFESNGEIISILLLFIVKFVTTTLDANSLIGKALDIIEIYSNNEQNRKEQQLNDFLNMMELRNECEVVDNYSIYRWLKKLLSIFVNRPIYGLQRREVLFEIYALHLCFLVCVYNIQACKLVPKQLEEFLLKFPQMLLNTANRFENNIFINYAIGDFITTIMLHLTKINKCENDKSNNMKMLVNRHRTLEAVQKILLS